MSNTTDFAVPSGASVAFVIASGIELAGTFLLPGAEAALLRPGLGGRGAGEVT